jgi:hypothetical protein
MSINRWLLIAGLLAIGACRPIPTAAICAVDEQNVNLDTEELLCPNTGAPASGAALPSDDGSDFSVQR